MQKIDKNEAYVAGIANSIPGINARLATREEDCGYHKADVVLDYLGRTFYLQVSITPKSGKEEKKLLGRGTYSVHTYRFQDMPLSRQEIAKTIEDIVFSHYRKNI